MPRVCLTIEYDGAPFHGWQMQPSLRTVQGELHRILEMILHQKIHCVHGSGRTDSGVHARGQVVAFDVAIAPDLGRLSHSISSILKGELSVRHAEIVSDSFHPRAWVTQKCYSYSILNRSTPAVLQKGRVWHVGATLNRVRMRGELESLCGTHDFTSFRAGGCQARSPVREILSATLRDEGDLLVIELVGKGFLKQMIRIIVGTVVEIGRGRGDKSLLELLALRDRTKAGPTAPPFGLCMEWVEYARVEPHSV